MSKRLPKLSKNVILLKKSLLSVLLICLLKSITAILNINEMDQFILKAVYNNSVSLGKNIFKRLKTIYR